MTQDPGWRPPRGLFIRALFAPYKALVVREVPLLVTLRMLTLAAPAHWLMLLAVLWAIEVTPHGGAWQALLIVAVGALDVAFVRARRSHIAAAEALSDLSAAYRTQFVLGYALAHGIVLTGFALYFTAGRIWLYLLATPFAAVMLMSVAPTTHALAILQRRLAASGSEVSVAEALMLPGGRIPGTRGSGPPAS